MEQEKEEYSYNRIVIVGNGLDLAMGLKTSYNDFLLDYFKESAEHARNSTYSDSMFSISNTNNWKFADPLQCMTVKDFIDLTMKNGSWHVTYHGILIEIIKNFSFQNWVDIESLYFDVLIPIIEHEKTKALTERDYKRVKELNITFKELTVHLDSYIEKLNKSRHVDCVIDKYYGFMSDIIERQTNKNTCLNHELDYENLPDPNKILFLNFNYTNSIRRLINRSIPGFNYSVIDIHGQSGSKSNPIIFGYGDDTHPFYAKIEEERSDVPLEFIKSFYYNRTTDYHQMLGFVESGPFEVYIVGHSCGLSDRTLLKSIFEHRDCISIKIFHKGAKDKSVNLNEHIRKNMAISRHFDNKEKLRKRVLPFDEHAAIPQVKE
ncbi:AbiH family protein [Flagellimonas crocea]|uniref:AbiH family protein n=1 Tax=Flagellimonas crocea TaxID=3067311 RepID=UPI00296EF508|nr:AbiH family protein [Muricauda sp. DH64]